MKPQILPYKLKDFLPKNECYLLPNSRIHLLTTKKNRWKNKLDSPGHFFDLGEHFDLVDNVDATI